MIYLVFFLVIPLVNAQEEARHSDIICELSPSPQTMWDLYSVLYEGESDEVKIQKTLEGVRAWIVKNPGPGSIINMVSYEEDLRIIASGETQKTIIQRDTYILELPEDFRLSSEMEEIIFSSLDELTTRFPGLLDKVEIFEDKTESINVVWASAGGGEIIINERSFEISERVPNPLLFVETTLFHEFGHLIINSYPWEGVQEEIWDKYLAIESYGDFDEGERLLNYLYDSRYPIGSPESPGSLPYNMYELFANSFAIKALYFNEFKTRFYNDLPDNEKELLDNYLEFVPTMSAQEELEEDNFEIEGCSVFPLRYTKVDFEKFDEEFLDYEQDLQVLPETARVNSKEDIINFLREFSPSIIREYRNTETNSYCLYPGGCIAISTLIVKLMEDEGIDAYVLDGEFLHPPSDFPRYHNYIGIDIEGVEYIIDYTANQFTLPVESVQDEDGVWSIVIPEGLDETPYDVVPVIVPIDKPINCEGENTYRIGTDMVDVNTEPISFEDLDFNNVLDFYDRIGADTLPFLEDEYLVPSDVLKALKVVTSDSSWGDPWDNPGGVYLNTNFIPGTTFDFLPLVSSKGEEFKSLLRNEAGFSTEESNRFYTLASTPGNLLLSREGYRKGIHFHERIHKIIEEQLTDEEITTLFEDRNEFRSWMISYEIGPDEYFMDEHFDSFIDTKISLGSWSELYAYMAQLEVLPSEDPAYRIDPEVYEEFEERYPEAYEIYRKVIGIALENSGL
ncbi:MAG: hypothetical protein CMH62_00260 [Nanoarchaeota archaeon]|nr:hypothetical protein [Nanoarchaeota archaeon]